MRLDHVEVEVARGELPGRLGQRVPIGLTVAIVPEPRDGAPPAGHWVFIPALGHALFVSRREDLATRLAAGSPCCRPRSHSTSTAGGG